MTNRNRDLNEMTHQELLAEFNSLSPTRRNANFKSKQEAVDRINALLIAPAVATAVVDTPAAEPVVMRIGDQDPKNVRTTRGANLVIKILTAEGRNPRREGTHAHRHFELMKGGVTVAEYLAHFAQAERRTARQWLANTVRDSHVALVEPDAEA